MEGGWWSYTPGKDAKRRLVVDTMEEPEVLRRDDVPKILNAENKGLILQYNLCLQHGLPYGDGWAKQPCIAMDIIDTLDRERALIKKARSENGN